MIVREATTTDAEIIALLARITFDETFGTLYEDRQVLLTYLNDFFSVGKMRKSIQKENTIFWIALVNELPVGYAKLKLNSPSQFLNAERVSQLQKIYVLKDFLGLKIGANLQDKVIEKAKKYGSDDLWLSVLNGNDRAIEFYEKNSFVKIGKHPFDIGKYTFHFTVMNRKL